MRPGVAPLVAFAAALLLSACSRPPAEAPEPYAPSINPAEFTSKVDNPYFTLTPGKRMVYEARTGEGLERTEVIVTDETRTVMGVETVVVWDRVWLDGELVEETRDWYAQDTAGNVWYFGEDTAEYEGGKVVSHAGAWEAGIDGAQPGIIMQAQPAAGDSYRQEYYAGEAEDMADVVALGETVTVPAGTFTGCLKTLDYTPLEPGIQEHKYYCPGAAGVVLEAGLQSGDRVELVEMGPVTG
jgi:hypothetical protein